MNRKIFGILLSIMLMTAFLTTAQNISTESKNYRYNETDTIFFQEGEVPVWEVGNKWTYKVDNIVINFEEPDLHIYIDGDIDDLKLEVDKVTENFYELDFYADIFGSYEFYTYVEDGPINITGELGNTQVNGTITYNKTDLAIEKVNLEISGSLTIKNFEQPYYDLSFLPDVPIPATIILDIDFVNPYPIIKFPIKIAEPWGLPSTNFTLTGTIESPWLKIANIINKIIRIPGVITILSSILKTDPALLQNMSDILDDILPTISIEYVLNKYLDIGNIFTIPEVPPILCCLSKDPITVLPGTFECYNVSLMGTNLGNIYFNNTKIKNFVKITGNFQDILPSIGNINAELTSYSLDSK